MATKKQTPDQKKLTAHEKQAAADRKEGINPEVRRAAEAILNRVADAGRTIYAPDYTFYTTQKKALDKAAIVLLVKEGRLELVDGVGAGRWSVMTEERREAQAAHREAVETAAAAREEIVELVQGAFTMIPHLEDQLLSVIDPVELLKYVRVSGLVHECVKCKKQIALTGVTCSDCTEADAKTEKGSKGKSHKGKKNEDA